MEEEAQSYKAMITTEIEERNKRDKPNKRNSSAARLIAVLTCGPVTNKKDNQFINKMGEQY